MIAIRLYFIPEENVIGTPYLQVLRENAEVLNLNGARYYVLTCDFDPATDEDIFPEVYDMSEDEFYQIINLAEDQLSIY
ncbi:MAG: hypothetical protein QXX12_02930 [Nanopusillaceae archaeon]